MAGGNIKKKQAMISLYRITDKGLFREICFFLVLSFQILLDDPFLAFYLDIYNNITVL